MVNIAGKPPNVAYTHTMKISIFRILIIKFMLKLFFIISRHDKVLAQSLKSSIISVNKMVLFLVFLVFSFLKHCEKNVSSDGIGQLY